MEKKVELSYNEALKAFVISDQRIQALTDQLIIPELTLPDSAYNRLYVKAPEKDAPTVGFLLGREGDCYSADWNDVRSIAKSGVNIRFIDYVHPCSQLDSCHGLILPGGAFPSPERYYTDPKEETSRSPRAFAYIVCIRQALKKGKPVLGICAGAQMLAGECGLKLYRDPSYINSKIEHKTKEANAHKVFITNQRFKELIGSSWLWTNSRHTETLVPDDTSPLSELKIFATAEDGVPEAWGNWDKNILCIQWHPEDGATLGNKKMQAIYNWLALKAVVYANE